MRPSLNVRSLCRRARARVLALAALGALAGGAVLPAGAQPIPTRTVSELRAAAAAESALPQTVRTRASVVRVDALRNLVFVDDGTAGLAVMPPDMAGLAPGAIVAIQGQLLIGGRGPTLAASEIDVVGDGPARNAVPLVWADLRAGALDARLVETRAIVRSVEPRGDAVRLRLMTEGGPIDADVTGTLSDEVAVDAVVQARGLLVPPEGEPGAARRQLLGVPADLRVVAPPVPDGDVPRLTVAALPRESARGALTRRVRLEGVVTRQRPGRSVYLRDATGAVYVETLQATPLAVGDRVEAIGYAAVDEFAPYLEDATYRRVGDGAPPAPVRASIGDLLNGTLDAELVETEGVLLAVDRGREEHTLVLQSGDVLFNAHVLVGRAGSLVDDLAPGSRLRLTGICSVVVDADRQPRSFRVLMRDGDDVVVMSGPATAGGVGWWPLAALALLAVGLAGGGVVYARRRQRRRDAALARALRRESVLKARLADLFDQATDIMIVHDRRGRIASLNRAGEQATGYMRDELRVLDPAWLLSQEYLDTIDRMLAEGADAMPRTFRAELITRKAARVPIEAHARVLAADGQVTGVETLARNTTEREQLEAQLRQSQKMEAVGRLATGVAHDFNNLITVLLGYSDDLIEGLGPGHPLRQSAEEIRMAAERASGLTQQLLAFSRRQASVTQSIDLNVTVANMRELLQRLLGADVTLELRLAPDLGLIRADPAQIGQVLMNLTVNARDAMPEGGRLTIATANVELGDEHLDVIPGPHVQLTVGDTGVGIPPEVRLRMFEPFFTTKGAGHGTGLGLSMVQGIVLQSNGHVEVESEPGHGATFRLYFPRVTADAAQTDEAAPSATPAKRPVASGVVLLAEDDRAVRRLMGNELRRRGFTVLEARHGGEALEICRQYGGNIDLLITDVVMPQVSGVELAATVAPIRPEMRVLYVSGHPDRAVSGFDGKGPTPANLLMKPFSPETLGQRVQEILRKR